MICLLVQVQRFDLLTPLQIWNRMVIWPTNPRKQRKKNRGSKCPHCKQRFSTRQALGGHVSKAHPGESETYNKKLQTRIMRTGERNALSLAKEIYKGLTNQTLDPTTAETFRYQRRRQTQAEKVLNEQILQEGP